MAESWAQGNLGAAAGELIRLGAVTTNTLFLLNDIPNCDITSRPCSTGSLASDNAYWFKVIDTLGRLPAPIRTTDSRFQKQHQHTRKKSFSQRYNVLLSPQTTENSGSD
jgi:hypothetical protein